MHKYNLFFLHGFFGRACDWNELPWPEAIRPDELVAGDLWRSFDELDPMNLADWGQRLALPEPPLIAIGYSLGGRLLAHALLARPERFAACVFVSCHPGLPAIEREARRQADRVWSDRLMTEAWPTLIADWNRQPVFSHSRPRALSESDFSRAILSRVMERMSLGQQEELAPRLCNSPVPQLWLAGEQDERFARLCAELASFGMATRLVPEAGHRVPWDEPDKFTQIVAHYMLELQSKP